MQQLQLSIPEPCHQEWNNMAPNEQGRFCNSCAKTVVDFSAMTDAQLIRYFENLKNENICGRVHTDQLDRAIQGMPEPRKKIVGYWQYLLAFFIMLGKGQQSKAQGNIKGQMVALPDTIKKPIDTHIRLGGIRKLPPPKNTTVIGAALPFYFITDEMDRPIANASVQMLPGEDWLVSDSSGKINLGKDHTAKNLVISAVGFGEKSIVLNELPGNLIQLGRKELLLEEVCVKSDFSTTSVQRMAGGISYARSGKVQPLTRDTIQNIFETKKSNLTIFPSPVARSGTFNVAIPLQQNGLYKIKIADAGGRIFLDKDYLTTTKKLTAQITIPATWSAGIYFVSLTDAKGKIIEKNKLVVE